jgi:hypothetical protein
MYMAPQNNRLHGVVPALRVFVPLLGGECGCYQTGHQNTVDGCYAKS